MTLHKLGAGNGYIYLARQVAANDPRETGYANLREYYTSGVSRRASGLDAGWTVSRPAHEPASTASVRGH